MSDFSQNDIWVIIGQVLSGMLFGAGAIWLTKVKKFFKSSIKMSFKDQINKNLRVRDILAEMRGFYHADRVKLYQFHNGDYFVSGESIQKMSLTHCVVRNGVNHPIGVQSLHQNIPVSYLTRMISAIIEKNRFFSHVSDLDDEFYMKGLLIQNGSESALLSVVRGKLGVILGVVIVTWMDEIRVKEVDLEQIEDFSVSIGAELSFTNND